MQPSTNKSLTSTTLLLAAMRCELKATARELKLTRKQNIYIGQRSNNKIIAAVIGIGEQHASNQAARLIEQHKPNKIILIGFCGSLTPAITTGQIIKPTCVINEAGQTIELHDDNHNTTRLLTVNHLISSEAEKQGLFEKYNAHAVDMESYPIAQLAISQDIPLTIRRTISDDANTQLPANAISWVASNGESRTGKAICDLLTNPKLIAVMLQLAAAGKKASKSLAKEVSILLH